MSVTDWSGAPLGDRVTLPCSFGVTTSSTVRFGVVVVFDEAGVVLVEVWGDVGAGVGVGEEWDHVAVSSEVSVSGRFVCPSEAVADVGPPLIVPSTMATATGSPGGRLTSWQVVVVPELLQPAPSPQSVAEPRPLRPEDVTVSTVLNAAPPLSPTRILS